MGYALTPHSCTVSGPSALHRSDGRPPIAAQPIRLPVRCHATLSGRQAAWALANLSRNPNNKMKIISLGALEVRQRGRGPGSGFEVGMRFVAGSRPW